MSRHMRSSTYKVVMLFRLETSPFDPSFIQDYIEMSEAAFGHIASEQWIHALRWRFENMPDVTIFIAMSDDTLIGYKAGHATAYNRYYSWMGAVHPNFRRRGVARNLMTRQHEWLASSRFDLVETQVSKENKLMIQMNLEAGLKTSGMIISKTGEPYLTMQRWFREDGGQVQVS